MYIWTWEGGLTGSAWSLGLKGLAYSVTPCRIDRPLLQRQSTSQGNMGDSEPPDRLVLLTTAACPLLLKHSTSNLSLLHLKIA